MKMTRNSALKWTAWLGIMVVVNGTSIGTMLLNEAASFVVGFQYGATTVEGVNFFKAIHPEVNTIAWWLVFVVLTVVAMLGANILIALFGDKSTPILVTPTPVIPAPVSALEAALNEEVKFQNYVTRNFHI